ncbi:hypothetical protein, partial [Escherichia coli]|uniref:hypothetical protein n=1 Tax=Escherichia coli TaxID=562 RepID=UPI0032E3D26E
MSTEVDKMRFNTIIDAHSFMKNYRSGEEQGKGTPVGDALYPVASYGDGRYVSRICFKGTVAKLAMRQPFVLFKGLTFQKLCLPGAFRPGDHHNKMLRP